MFECPTIEACIVVARGHGDVDMEPGRDTWWHQEMAAPEVRGCEAYEPMRAEDPLFVVFEEGLVKEIVDPEGRSYTAQDLEPELITYLFDESREKRRRIRYEDLPEHLVQAVLAIEDRRFRSVYGSVTGESLTRNPKGFPKDHPYGNLLRLKDVVFSRPLSDKEVFSAELPDIIAKDLNAARPVLLFLDKLAGPRPQEL